MNTDETTFAAARERLQSKHRDACLEIHRLITETPEITNRDFPKLREARKAEVDTADDLMRLNDVVFALKLK